MIKFTESFSDSSWPEAKIIPTSHLFNFFGFEQDDFTALRNH